MFERRLCVADYNLEVAELREPFANAPQVRSSGVAELRPPIGTVQ